MLLTLKPHPDSPAGPVTGLEVEVTPRPLNVLELRYSLAGRTSEIAFPPRGHGRADDLWRHTCLELFIRQAGQDGYVEFNFAPSTQWAAYRFDGYRAGMRVADEFKTLDMAGGGRSGLFELRVAIDLDGVVDPGADWTIALAAVIEDRAGALSYWALNHPAGNPDFHHPEGFTFTLPATDHP
jgi:hypothetical protein